MKIDFNLSLSFPFFTQKEESLLSRIEEKTRLAALRALPPEFSNKIIHSLLQHRPLPEEFRDHGVAVFAEEGGRVVLVHEKTLASWDLFRREAARSWGGKVRGKRLQILEDGRSFVHIKEVNRRYDKGADKVCKFARVVGSGKPIVRLIAKIHTPRCHEKHQIGLRAMKLLEDVPGIVEHYGDVGIPDKKGQLKRVSYQRYYRHADLISFYKEREEPLPLEACNRIAGVLLNALGKMHERRIYHRDLKEENILLDEGPDGLFDVAICDFDISWFEGQPLGSRWGTWWSLAPERAYLFERNEEAFTQESDLAANDVWAMGTVLYTLYHRECLFGPVSSEEEILKKLSLLSQSKGAPFTPTLPIDSLLEKMLQIDPKDRISACLALQEFERVSNVRAIELIV